MTSSNSVRLIFFEQSIGCETCAPTRRALEALARDHANVELEVLNLVLDKERAAEHAVDRVPALIIAAGGFNRIRYYGAPLGNELPGLVQAIQMAASGESALPDEARQRLAELTRPVHLQVFFTPTCGYCPRMVALANQVAVASPLVSTAAIDAAEFPDLVRKYNVNGVPKTVIDDRVELLGAVADADLIAAMIDAGREA